MGDSIYQLLFMREVSEYLNQTIEEIHIQTGKPATFSQPHVYGNEQITEKAARYLLPLLASQMITVSISDECPEGFLDLDQFRDLKLNFSSGDIREWVYNLVDFQLPMNLSRPTLKVTPDRSFSNKIILAKTSRYNNVMIDYDLLRPLEKDIVMIGLMEEWQDFCQRYFYVEFCSTNNALQAAQMIAGSRMFISNQCGLFSIAESLKTPRILLTAEYIDIERSGVRYAYPGPVNVICQGGEFAMVGTNAKLEGIVDNILHEKR